MSTRHNSMSMIAFKKIYFFSSIYQNIPTVALGLKITIILNKVSCQIWIYVKNKDEKIIPNRLNKVSILVWMLGSVLSDLSECPNRAECPNESRAVRKCPTVRACPTNILGFFRPKAEPRPFCPSRAILSELSDVRMPTPVKTPQRYKYQKRPIMYGAVFHRQFYFFGPKKFFDKI